MNRELNTARTIIEGAKAALGIATDANLCTSAMKIKRERDELLSALQALLHFNEELCADVGVSKHYPSAEQARAAIAKAEGGP